MRPEKGAQALPPATISVQYYNDRAIAATIPANAAVKTNTAKSASFSPIQCLFETGRRLVGTVWNKTKTIAIAANNRVRSRISMTSQEIVAATGLNVKEYRLCRCASEKQVDLGLDQRIND